MAENNNLFKYFTGSIEDFLLKIKKSDNHLIKKIISPVSQRMANYLSINGINVDSSYNHVVDNYSIIHVMNGHSNIAKEQARGQIPITYKDIKMIDKVINEFDNIVVDNGKIVYAKKLPDGTVLYIEEVRRGRKELAFVSMRKMKGNIPNDLMEKMLSPENLNAWNDSAILPSDGNIPQNPENASDTDNNLRFSVAPDIDTPAFKDWFRNSKVVDQDGKPLVVYHGTNWDILSEAPGEAVFDDKYRGAGSGDNGFYGRGFYFTFGNGEASKGEAGYYGKNVYQFYLSIQNPFYFTETLLNWNGKRVLGDEVSSVEIINAVKLFPELLMDLSLDTYDQNGGFAGEITLDKYARMFEKTYKEKKFLVRKTSDPNEIVVECDPIKREEDGV